MRLTPNSEKSQYVVGMGFLLDKCSFSPLDEEVIGKCCPFSCGNADLDDFFRQDASLYSRQMLGKSYCFRLGEDPSVIVCAFTLSNDSIRVDILPNSREKKVQKDIPRSTSRCGVIQAY